MKLITEEVDKKELRTPAVTELEAFIYQALNNYEAAINKFEELLALENAGYSFTAIEQYYNIRIKHLAAGIDSSTAAVPGLEKEFRKAISDLQALIQINPSLERYNLLGSAWKRNIYFYKENKSKAQHALTQAYKSYQLAFEISKEKSVYAYVNWISLQNILVIAGAESWDKKETDMIKKQLQQMEDNSLQTMAVNDYWSMILISNLKLCAWMLSATTGKEKTKMPDAKAVVESYASVWKMIGTLDNKKIEIQHINTLIQAFETLQPGHFIIPAITGLRDKLNDIINGVDS